IRVSKKINQINPHVIHSFHYGNSYGEALAGKISRAKWIFTKKNMNWGSDGANAWKLRSFLADFIVVQNTKMIEEFYPDSKKIRLIERGIQVGFFSEFVDNIDAVYSEMNTPVEARVIACVANISPVKGVHYLIEAFQSLEKDNWHLWLIGDDKSDYAQQLKSDIEMNVENGKNIHFSGKKNDVRPYVKAAEIFVLPTTKTGEGSPVALLEAMAMKKVVLGSRVPGIEDQLKEFEQHMFESENADSLASALHRLLKNTKAKNEELGQDFYNHVSKKYHINREVAQHEKLYTELCSN
ncbi:MAG: glycosyltransferase family 4 protein, partial [Schleiferiaceae bacterium]|nr:glycosyltransferase family 4 protein [Schleiferiaceae bacterium]